jgi:hypothetical protein
VADARAPVHPGLRLRWLGSEDEAGGLGDVDAETLRTLVFVAAGGRARCAGPVTPQPGTLRRPLTALLAAASPAGGAGDRPEIEAFVARPGRG